VIDLDAFALFERTLATDPLARCAPRGVAGWRMAEPGAVFDEARLRLRGNAGGGDCLLHALAGEDLPRNRVHAMRRTIAGVRMRMPLTPRANARRVLAALLQTPETRTLGIALAEQGLCGASNFTLAALQCVAGVHAGEAEIAQWCAASGASVLAVGVEGRMCRATSRSSRTWQGCAAGGEAAMARAIGRGVAVLFRAGGHWWRVEAV
jgi:hypothetical protein